MSDKIPFKKVRTEYGWDYKPIELTGKCKRVTHPNGKSYEYAQCQRRLFGLKIGTYWVYNGLISLAEPKKVEYYDCNITE